ncbi:hypothetical protein [Kitasatospora sp. NPDC093679]|uniref:hypothetical protein n=1 Tax=Kitasatospora sp. NPDC093679 TaxID=3154983 RepID=UPI003447D3E8
MAGEVADDVNGAAGAWTMSGARSVREAAPLPRHGRAATGGAIGLVGEGGRTTIAQTAQVFPNPN